MQPPPNPLPLRRSNDVGPEQEDQPQRHCDGEGDDVHVGDRAVHLYLLSTFGNPILRVPGREGR